MNIAIGIKFSDEKSTVTRSPPSVRRYSILWLKVLSHHANAYTAGLNLFQMLSTTFACSAHVKAAAVVFLMVMAI